MSAGTKRRGRGRTAECAEAAPETAASVLEHFTARARVEIPLPSDAHVIGEPVTVTRISVGSVRVGLRASCERDGRSYDISLADVIFGAGSPGASLVAGYRAWLGLEPGAAAPGALLELRRAHKIGPNDVTPGQPVELIVLARKSNALRCRLAGSAREVTLRTAVRDEVQGAIITVKPARQWTHARHPYLSGQVSAIRVDAAALGLVPLALRDEGEWDPAQEYWGEDGDPIDDWAKPIIARGLRPMYELEQVLPGADPHGDSDPIIDASELRAAGDVGAAIDLVESLLAKDLRCLDAHAHLGNFVFDHLPRQALRHYEVGAAIGALSLPDGFDGVLAWGLVDNRPYLRCLHGLGLCMWRLGRPREAAGVFNRMLWLNPGDHQGVRFELAAIEAGKAWQELTGSNR